MGGCQQEETLLTRLLHETANVSYSVLIQVVVSALCALFQFIMPEVPSFMPDLQYEFTCNSITSMELKLP